MKNSKFLFKFQKKQLTVLIRFKLKRNNKSIFFKILKFMFYLFFELSAYDHFQSHL